MTRRSAGPSKKLVPSLSNDMKCEHRFEEEDGATLEVDCSRCSGAQSIDNPKCASGVMNVLASGLAPEAVVLKRYIHVRYRSHRIAGLCESASALAALRRLQGQADDSSDDGCRTCPASRRVLAPEVIRRLQADPLVFCRSRDSLSDSLMSELSGVRCPRLSRCVAQAVWAGLSHPGGRG